MSKKKLAWKAAVFAAPFVWRWWRRRRQTAAEPRREPA